MADNRAVKDGGYGWVVVFGGFLFTFLEVGTIKSFGVFLSVVIDELDTSPGVIGFAFGLCSGLTYLLGPLWSVLYVPNRLIVYIASILVTASLALTSSCQGPVAMTLILSVTGIGYSIPSFWITIAIKEYFPTRFSLAFSLTTAGRAAGMIIIPVFAERLLEWYGWRGAFLIIAGVNFHLAVAAALTRTPDEKQIKGDCFGIFRHIFRTAKMHKKNRDNRESDKISCDCVRSKEIKLRPSKITEPEALGAELQNPSGTRNKPSCHDNTESLPFLALVSERLSPLRNMLRDYSVLFPLLTSYLLLGISMTGVILFLVPNATEKGISLSQATVLSAIFGIGDLVGRPLIGLLHTKTRWGSINLCACLTIFSSVTFFVYPFTGAYAILAVNAFLNGAALGAIAVLSAINLTELLPREVFKYAYGLYFLSFGIGAPLGGLIAGKYKDWTSSYQYAFVFFGALAIVSSLLQMLAWRINLRRQVPGDKLPLLGGTNQSCQ